MHFRHGVMDGDEMFILHIFDGDGMIFVHFFRFQGRQCDAAAADHSISQCVDSITADRADIEFAAQILAETFLLMICSPFISSITEIPSACANGCNRLISGSPLAVSHLEMALLLTPIFSDSSA